MRIIIKIYVIAFYYLLCLSVKLLALSYLWKSNEGEWRGKEGKWERGLGLGLVAFLLVK